MKGRKYVLQKEAQKNDEHNTGHHMGVTVNFISILIVKKKTILFISQKLKVNIIMLLWKILV
jgi:hypothetical protein